MNRFKITYFKKITGIITSIWKKFFYGMYYILFKKCHGLLQVPTDMTMEERIILYEIGRKLRKENIIVEIGSYLGASSTILAIAAKETNGHLFCIDTWQNDGMSEGKRDTYELFLKNTSNFAGWITSLRGYSENISKEFKDGIDLLFIDGDHSYNSVKKDLNNWLPKLNKNGWIIMHDCGWAEGVKRVINEIIIPIQCQKPKRLPNLFAVRVNYIKPQNIEINENES